MNQAIPIFDGHNDTLLNLHLPERGGGGRNFFERGLPEQGHIDLPRAREGGLAGGFFAIFAPSQKHANDFSAYATDDGYDFPMPPALEHKHAMRATQAMMSRLFRIERESGGQVRVTRTVGEIEICLRAGTLAAILHFEGAEAIDRNFHALEVFYQAGLRSLGLVWSRPNSFAHGVPLKFPSTPDNGPGLTDVGKALVRACNQLGIMLDLSHLNAAGFWDVAAISDAPLVATHSNVHALCPIGRNLTDQQLDAIRASDGMVGLNFGVGFLREDGRWDTDTPLETLVRHIDYLVERIGISRVGLGSDFDGAQIPAEIADVAGLPKLLAALRRVGYDEAALRKLAHENWIRVLRQTWRGGNMIRKYEDKDLNELLDTWHSASQVAHPFLGEDFLEQERRAIADVHLPNAETWVFELEGVVVGFIALIGNEVGAIFVAANHHSQGIGRALMDHARSIRDGLELDVFSDNLIGRRFYEKYGFVQVDEHRHEETGFMQLRLKLPR